MLRGHIALALQRWERDVELELSRTRMQDATVALLLALLLLLGLGIYFGTRTANDGRVKDGEVRRARTYTTATRTHGVLQPNYEAEELEQEEQAMFSMSKATLPPGTHLAPGMSARHQKMLFYDVDRTTGWSAMRNLSQTCLADLHLWHTCSVYFLIVGTVASSVVGAVWHGISWDVGDSVDQLGNATAYLGGLMGFMLGLFVSEIIRRWWACRLDCVEALWSALSDIQLHLAYRLPDPAEAPIRETVVRLGLLSHRLMYAEIRGTEGREFLQRMVDVHLLTPEELRRLDGQHSKAQLVLVWMGLMFVELAQNRGGPHAFGLSHLEVALARARGAIGKAFAYVATQLPYQYVHLLSFCVILTNVLLALKCGAVIGQCLCLEHPNYIRAGMNFFQIIVVPFAYHAFLRLCSELANPFGHDFSDFPGFAHHCYMRSEQFAIQKAGEEAPAELVETARAKPPQ